MRMQEEDSLMILSIQLSQYAMKELNNWFS